MPIVLTANYNIELTQPSHPTHQFSLRLQTQVADLKQARIQCARLHALLQSSLNQAAFNRESVSPARNGNGQLLHGRIDFRRARHHGTWHRQAVDIWRLFANCNLDRQFIEGEAQARFGQPVARLNDVQARELIRALYE